MTTDQLQFNFPPSDTQTKWTVGLFQDDVLVHAIDGSPFDTFDEAVTARQNYVAYWAHEAMTDVVWEDAARGTGWFGVKNVPGESTTVYALFITKA